MNHQEKLTAVREKIVEACPELAYNCPGKLPNCKRCENSSIIRLGHLLRALPADYAISNYGDFVTLHGFPEDDHYMYKGPSWDLIKDLSGQSEATIDFLFDVFYKT